VHVAELRCHGCCLVRMDDCCNILGWHRPPYTPSPPPSPFRWRAGRKDVVKDKTKTAFVRNVPFRCALPCPALSQAQTALNTAACLLACDCYLRRPRCPLHRTPTTHNRLACSAPPTHPPTHPPRPPTHHHPCPPPPPKKKHSKTSLRRASEDDLVDFFSQCGTVVDLVRRANKEGKLNAFCHVQFDSREAMERACQLTGSRERALLECPPAELVASLQCAHLRSAFKLAPQPAPGAPPHPPHQCHLTPHPAQQPHTPPPTHHTQSCWGARCTWTPPTQAARREPRR
jgi:hypothetical protein